LSEEEINELYQLQIEVTKLEIQLGQPLVNQPIDFQFTLENNQAQSITSSSQKKGKQVVPESRSVDLSEQARIQGLINKKQSELTQLKIKAENLQNQQPQQQAQIQQVENLNYLI